MSRAKVAHVVVAGEIGGAEHMLVDLSTRPDASAADHVILLMTPNEGLSRLFRDAGVALHDRGRVHENAAAYLWRSLGPLDARWLADAMATERATVAHLHTFASHVVGTRAARAAGLPIVRTEHSTRAYTDPSCWPFSRWSLRRTSAVVAISRHIEEIALRRAPWIRARTRVIHNGVDLARFAPAGEPATSEGPTKFAIVARLEPRKGVDLAIDALASLPDATLDVVGDGEERAALEARARRLGARVTFHGRLADVRPILAACDAFVCSSRQEGLGIAVLEAMAAGKPVVAFKVGGVPEVVVDGATGWLTGASTADALAAKMREACADRARLARMGTAARARVVERFSIDAMCRAYAEVYADAARRA